MKHPIILFLLFTLVLSACQPATPPSPSQALHVIAAESFLADIAQQVAGQHFTVTSLIPDGSDPHTYQPTPKDVAAIAETDLFIINGGGLETWLPALVKNANNAVTLVTASDGLTPRTLDEAHDVAQPEGTPGTNGADDHDTESAGHNEHETETADEHAGHGHATDPHFWLDPNLVVTYVQNIQKAYSTADPDHAADYETNAKAYIAQLEELDTYIQQKTAGIPPENRQLVTTHEALGYFALRYGYTIVGTIIPGFSTDAEPSARDLASLVEQIRASQTKALFLNEGSNQKLAEQLSAETGVTIVTDLRTHAIAAEGQSAGYLSMMRHNIDLIAGALK